MPLNGRNFLSLATLTAGTSPSVGGRTQSEGGFVSGGAHGYQMNVQVDGLDNNTNYSGGPVGFEAQAVKPSIDAVGEFKVITNNLSAEYGGRMGGTVLVNIKSGTNQFHGTAYEFLRNDALDGTNFFANRSGAAKPEYRQNQFGGTLGGPIRKNKTFLFGSFDGTRIRSGTSSISTVPTAAELTGDFSKIRRIFDPATTLGTGGSMTRQPFPGDLIPKSRWDPLFPKLLALYPPATTTGIVNNYYFSGADRNDWNNYDFKGDHNFNDTNRLSVRYSRRDKDQYQNGPLPLPADGGLATTTIDPQQQRRGQLLPHAESEHQQRIAHRPVAHAHVVRHPVRQAAVRRVRHQGDPEDQLCLVQRPRPDALHARGLRGAGFAQLLAEHQQHVHHRSSTTFCSDLRGKHSFKVGWRVQAQQHVPQRGALRARTDGVQSRIHCRPAEPRRDGRRTGRVHARLGAGGSLGNENGENLMIEHLRRVPPGRLEDLDRA